MDNFYITLPSNASLDVFPNNTKSNYTTLLSQNLILNGSYEVALTDISFSSNIGAQIGSITIKKLWCLFNNICPGILNDISINLDITNGLSREEFVNYINSQLKLNITVYQLFIHSFLFKNPKYFIETEFFKKFETALENFTENSDVYCFQNIDESVSNPIIQPKTTVLAVKNKIPSRIIKGTLAIPFSNITSYQYLINAGGVVEGNFINIQYKTLLEAIKTVKNTEANIIILRYSNNLDNFIKLIGPEFSKLNEKDILSISKLQDYKLFKDKKFYKTEIQLELNKKDQKLYNFQLYNSLDSYDPIFSKKNDLSITSLHCNGIISEFLFNNQTRFFSDELYYIPEKISIIKYIAIYTDIIEEQFIGNVSAPILQVIPFENMVNRQIINVNITNLHYVPVNKNYINTIKITINDLFGNQIRFKNDFIYAIIKLHFRKIKNE